MATIEIDGKTIEVDNGKMIIEVADEAGIHIPRFCYHKKLSVAANCRMCLVEIENSKKTVPACATPISNGMKVFTKSNAAIRSQKAVMDFLLINHPLDCPICDQGGECELQDVSMGYGDDHSTYDNSKRAVANDDLGPLIATEMTRCIHCTRCVRFGDEIAGLRELGATGRGEDTQIGTYIQHSITSEISGNIIDLCPVGALTTKPYRFTARAWEMTQHESIAPHDCLGSNIYLHTRRNRLMRVVPKEQETINETWLSDRDRFSYLGLHSEARAAQPMIKQNGQWEAVDWESALKYAAAGMARVIKQHGAEQFAALASASSTLEELYLLQKMMRDVGVHNLDHRLQQVDFRDQHQQPIMPESSLPYAELEEQHALLLLGCNIERELPLAGVRVRKAFKNGGQVFAMNVVDYNYHFGVAQKIIVSPQELPMQLASLIAAVAVDVERLPESIQKLLLGLEPSAAIQQIAAGLQQQKSAIVTGAIVENHPHAALLRTLVATLEQLTGARVLRFTNGANSAGACLAGMLPHRSSAGKVSEPAGLDVKSALEAHLKGYLLMGADPSFDFANPYQARQAMLAAEFVVVLTSYADETMQDYADVILPMATFSETSGTFINVDKTWQSFKGAVTPYGEARPAWKILRVLANLMHCHGFEYTSTNEVFDELKIQYDMMQELAYQPFYPESLPMSGEHLERIGEWPLYRCDAIVRHATPLQSCAAADVATIKMHPDTADRFKLDEIATISQGNIEITLPLQRDARIAKDAVWVPNALPETVDLGQAYAAITIK